MDDIGLLEFRGSDGHRWVLEGRRRVSADELVAGDVGVCAHNKRVDLSDCVVGVQRQGRLLAGRQCKLDRRLRLGGVDFWADSV